MSIIRRDDTVTNTLGQAIAGASVFYLGPQPANLSTLTPLLPVYSNTSGTPAANPQITDGFGHAVAYLNDGALFTCVYVYPNGTTVVYPDQFVGNSSGTPTTFAGVPQGTIDGSRTTFVLTNNGTPLSIPPVVTSVLGWLNFPLINGLGFVINAGANPPTITYATPPQPASGGSPADSIFAQGFLA